MVHFIRRDHQTWPCLFYFTSCCRIEGNQVNFKLLYYHVHSFLSKSFSKPSEKSFSGLSPSAIAALNCSSHPALGLFAAVITIWLSVTLIETSSFIEHITIICFGRMIPFELPNF